MYGVSASRIESSLSLSSREVNRFDADWDDETVKNWEAKLESMIEEARADTRPDNTPVIGNMYDEFRKGDEIDEYLGLIGEGMGSNCTVNFTTVGTIC